MLNVIAPNRREALLWRRQAGLEAQDMRIITRAEQLRGMHGAEVILVNRGAIVGTTEDVLELAYALERAGDVTLRIEFTK